MYFNIFLRTHKHTHTKRLLTHKKEAVSKKKIKMMFLNIKKASGYTALVFLPLSINRITNIELAKRKNGTKWQG